MMNLRRNRTEDDEGLFVDGKPAAYTRRSLYILSGIGIFLILVVITPALIATRPRSVRGGKEVEENTSLVTPTFAPMAVESPAAAPQDVLSQSASVQLKVTDAPTASPVVSVVSSPTSQSIPAASPTAQTPVANTAPKSPSASQPTPTAPAQPKAPSPTPAQQQQPKPSSVYQPPPTPARPPQPKPSSVYQPPPTPAQPPQPKPSSVYHPPPVPTKPAQPKPPSTTPATPVSSPVEKPASTPKTPSSHSFDPLYINSGSKEKIVLTENGKKKWVSDLQSNPRYSQFGDSKDNQKACERNEEDRLLCSERWYAVEGGYIIPAPKGGKYQIIMYFEEVIHTDPNFQRRFKIYVQDFLVRKEYDIMEEAEGPNKLTTVKWVIDDLQQDEINIRFETIKGKDHAKISAVEIRKM